MLCRCDSRTRVRFPPPPPNGFELLSNRTLKRRQNWRRLCVSRVSGSSKRLGELIQRDVVGVLLGRVRARVAHQRLERDDVAPALAEKAVSKPVAKLVRRQLLNAGPLADSPDHPHQCLIARRKFCVLAVAPPLRRRHPLLDLDREDVVIELGLELTE